MPTKKYVDKIKATLTGVTDGSATDRFDLGEETLNQLLTITNDWTFIDTIGTSAKVAAINRPNQGSIVVHKTPNVSLTAKTALGGKTPALTNFQAVTIQWGKPREAKAGLTAYDAERGLNSALASYLAKYLEEGRYKREIDGWEEVSKEDTKKTANTLSAATLGNADAFKKSIVKSAIELTQLIDNSQGLKLINRQDIVIHISEEHAYKLSNVIGNLATQTFENGIYSFGTIEGFRFIVNPLLAKVASKPVAIITTNFAFKSFHGIIGSGIDRLVGSTDSVVYYEDAIAQGLIYDKVVKCLYV